MSIFPRPNRNPVYAALLMIGAYVLLRFVGVGIMEVGLAFLALALAAVLVLDWFYDKQSRRRSDEIEAGQEDLKILQIYAAMTPDDRADLQDSRMIKQHVLGWGDTRFQFVYARGLHEKIIFDHADVQAVWTVCNAEYFAPVSTWGDETIRRRCASSLLQWGCDRGWLKPPSGPYAATWIGEGYNHMAKELWGG